MQVKLVLQQTMPKFMSQYKTNSLNFSLSNINLCSLMKLLRKILAVALMNSIIIELSIYLKITKDKF